MTLNALIALCAATLAACSGAGASRTRIDATEIDTLRIRGSDTMLQVCERWADAYAHVAPDVRMTVSGGGTGSGIAALVNGTADIAAASRRMTSSERQRVVVARGVSGVHELPAMLDALVFYVHRDNPVQALSIAQLQAAFAGRADRWQALGGDTRALVLYGRENSSGTYLFFKDRILDGLDFAPRVLALQGTGAVLSAVANDPSGLGYGGLGFSSRTRRVALRLANGSEVTASAENVRSGRYPLTRALMLYTLDPPAKPVAMFLRWVQSAEGQREITRAGHFPLNGDGLAPES